MNEIRNMTVEQLAKAAEYVLSEFRTPDNYIDSEMWAEGLAFARYTPSREAYRIAQECLSQLTQIQWAQIQTRAEHMRACDGFAGFDR